MAGPTLQEKAPARHVRSMVVAPGASGANRSPQTSDRQLPEVCTGFTSGVIRRTVTRRFSRFSPSVSTFR